MRNTPAVVLVICAVLLMLACVNPALDRIQQGAAYNEQAQWE